MTKFDKEKIIEQLESLKNLPKIKEVKALRQRLEKELEKFEEQELIKEIPESNRNEKISKSLKQHFRYLRLIRNNFPDLSWTQLRNEYSKRKKGFDSDVPDFVWQNPSP